MISDSIPWRVDLLATAERLEKRKCQRRWSERTSFLIERDVMVGAYSVRRLKESYKVSDELAARKFTIELHELSGSVPDVHNSHKFWDLYDLGVSSNVELSLNDVCNQIIHSWVWGFAAGGDGYGLGGIFVSSDRKRRKCLYFLSIDMLIDLFRSIGEEDIYHIEMRRDESGEMHYTRIKGRPFGSTEMDGFELPEGLK